jgi:hypothetical protein
MTSATCPGLRKRIAAMAAALCVACALGGCSSGMIDAIPTPLGGLPEGAPQRPAMPVEFPAVHDMPPARVDTALSEAERKRLREDLISTRERNAKAAAPETEQTPPPAGTTRDP